MYCLIVDLDCCLDVGEMLLIMFFWYVQENKWCVVCYGLDVVIILDVDSNEWLVIDDFVDVLIWLELVVKLLNCVDEFVVVFDIYCDGVFYQWQL